MVNRKRFSSVEEAADHIIANDIDQSTRDHVLQLDRGELISLHFTLGMYVRNNYEVTITDDDPMFPTHPDDVSFKVLEEIHRKLKSDLYV
ncbi:hypothetical protein D3P08_03805 [Paenibacillus nanensis]|uniref:DUF6794 domain-containing protein n=1 Tax=Paenibacillus nanensis TaxID=393251 RepID=A0A3A1VPB6_9BACL|nr:DUF6794 domain-containing protein [Paenibacillus nanensis]RIX59290.1 hypothetical protein D3P08_03805 [Paenibacillus nanensis]